MTEKIKISEDVFDKITKSVAVLNEQIELLGLSDPEKAINFFYFENRVHVFTDGDLVELPDFSAK